MSSIFSFFTSLLAKISNFAAWLLQSFKQLFLDIWNIFTDLLCWFVESILSIALTALNAVSIPFNPQSYYSLIPAQTADVLGYIGFPNAVGIIVSGLVIRFTLQTIPFVRWGS